MFNTDIQELHLLRSDVLPEILDQFGELKPGNVQYSFLEPGEVMDSSIQSRVLATAGYQILSIHETVKALERPGAKYYELTGFCSFGKRLGKAFLEFTMEQFFGNRKSPIAVDRLVPQYFTCTVVIAEHNLVPYYTQVCGFSRSSKADVHVTVSDIPEELEQTVKFTRDFHIYFLYREIVSRG